VTDDAVRSVVVSYKLLGTEDWFVIHHTDCGMQYATDADIARLLATSRRAAAWDGAGWRDEADGSGTTDGEFVRWLTIVDPAAALCADLRRLRDHPLVPPVGPHPRVHLRREDWQTDRAARRRSTGVTHGTAGWRRRRVMREVLSWPKASPTPAAGRR
jgi:hypothetical protein